MGSSYHQFCPVAKAMELLDERWTLLIVRELVAGSERFNDLRRGVPRMSPTLLSKRLGQLVRAGVVDRRDDGGEVRYVLTPAGRELQPVVEALGTWGIRWIGEIGDEDLDPKLLLWDMHRNVDYAAVPPGRTVVQFRFRDVPPATRDWWLVIGTRGNRRVRRRPRVPGRGHRDRQPAAADRGLARRPELARCPALRQPGHPRPGTRSAGRCLAGSPCRTSPRSARPERSPAGATTPRSAAG